MNIYHQCHKYPLSRPAGADKFLPLLDAPWHLVRAASISLDPGFSPPFFATPDYASRVTLLPDGSYVMNFNIDTLSDQPTGAIIKFLPDGTLDTSFNFSSDYDFVGGVAALSDGRLIVSAGTRNVYGVAESAEHYSPPEHRMAPLIRLSTPPTRRPRLSANPYSIQLVRRGQKDCYSIRRQNSAGADSSALSVGRCIRESCVCWRMGFWTLVLRR